MKKLMVIAAAALTCAALAQEPEGAAKPGSRRGPRGPMMSERGMMPPRGAMGGLGMPGDPAVMAVMNPRIAEKIGVSKEVQDQIRKIDMDSRKDTKELQQKTRAAMEKQAQLMKEPKIDEAAVMAAIDELFDLRKEMAKAQTKRLIAVKALLTPEQLTKALDAMKEMRDERRSRRAPKPEAKQEAKPAAEPEKK